MVVVVVVVVVITRSSRVLCSCSCSSSCCRSCSLVVCIERCMLCFCGDARETGSDAPAFMWPVAVVVVKRSLAAALDWLFWCAETARCPRGRCHFAVLVLLDM